MSFRPRNGHRTITSKEIRKMSPFEQKGETIDFAAGQYRSKTMLLGIVTHKIRCRLSGTYTVADANSTLKPYAALRLIKNLDVFLNTSDKRFSQPGFDLQNRHFQYYRTTPRTVAPGNTQASHNFVYSFDIPIDAGDYFSPISAYGARSFNLGVQWGTVDDMATAGGGGSHSLSNVQLEFTQIGVVGQDDTAVGGRMRNYMRHIISHQIVPITATNPKLKIDLQNDVWYSGLTIYAWSNGQLVDTIVNNVQFSVYTNNSLPRSWDDLADMNQADYNQVVTGMRFVDLGRPEHTEDMIVLSGPDRLQLELDVTNVATDELYIIEDTFIETPNVAG